jgi:hypothetical protein
MMRRARQYQARRLNNQPSWTQVLPRSPSLLELNLFGNAQITPKGAHGAVAHGAVAPS